MKVAEYKQIGTHTETRTRFVPAQFDDDGIQLEAERMETYTVDVPDMGVVYRDMTADEVAAMEADAVEVSEELEQDDMLEILADHEFRICLMELGVNEDDL